jgi:hypothetical protein
MSRLIVAALVLLCAVFGLLGVAAWNRSGEPQALTLTERELTLPATWENGRGDDDAELRLRFVFEPRDDPQDAKTWLTDGRLRELGFSTAVAPGSSEAEQHYRRQLPRLAWVAFEYDGPEWQRIEQRRAMTAGERDRRVWWPVGRSRLVPIDAALDSETLLRRHEGRRVLAMPAVVEMRYRMDRKQGPAVWGRVARLVSDSVVVPAPLRTRLVGVKPFGREPAPGWRPGELLPDPEAPRYEVGLRIGRLGSPWIADVHRTDSLLY